jgi:hypothetical protein
MTVVVECPGAGVEDLVLKRTIASDLIPSVEEVLRG